MATKQINVEILGKGDDQVTIEEGTTIGELRNLLAQDDDVSFIDAEGNKLNNESIVKGDLSVTPEVEGGSLNF